jgi:hypothetical protein
VIPGPRPPEGPDRPPADRDRGLEVVRPQQSGLPMETPDGSPGNERRPPDARVPSELSPVTLTRTARGWSVVSPSGTAHAGDVVEGLSLADLIAEEFGALAEPDRTARRSARGPGGAGEVAADPTDGRVAALERTVAQLEHALAARVSTERAIGVLAERHRTSPRAAFESLRREARSGGRPVAELAREVLDGLEWPRTDADGAVPTAALAGAVAPPGPRAVPLAQDAGPPAPVPSPAVAAADAGS